MKKKTDNVGGSEDGIREVGGEGYRICGERSKSGICKRIGKCPYHPKESNGEQKKERNFKKPKIKKIPYRLSWKPDEHLLFLKGLQVYGRGKWKLIATLIPNRNSRQVTSHAQKYFGRQEQKDKKKESIHDMTLAKVLTNSGKREIALNLNLPPDHMLYSFPFEKIETEEKKDDKKKKKEKENMGINNDNTPLIRCQDHVGTTPNLLERVDWSVNRNPKERSGNADSFGKIQNFKKDLRPFPYQSTNIGSNESTPRSPNFPETSSKLSETPISTPMGRDSEFMLIDRDDGVNKELQFDLDAHGTTSVLGKRERTTDPTTYLSDSKKKRKKSDGGNENFSSISSDKQEAVGGKWVDIFKKSL